MKICVLGAGIVGTTTALRIKQKFPQCHIDVVAEVFCPAGTTSEGAAGFWQPHMDPDTPWHRVEKWSAETFRLLERLWFRPNELPKLADLTQAISLVPAFEFVEEKGFTPPLYASIVLDYRQLERKDMDRMGQPTNMIGYGFTSFTFEPKLALPLLYSKLRSLGARLLQRRVNDMNELSDYDLVVNCSGAGAKSLVGDECIRPIRGHLLRVRAPWVHCMMANPDCYVIPNQDSVVLGSMDEVNCWSVTPRPGDRELLLAKCLKLCPSLAGSQVVGEWVGLRPVRAKGVRLEVGKNMGNTKVIHNYGHGGSGITLSWGCAGEVVQLVEDLMSIFTS